MILLSIIAEPRQQYRYTVHHAKYKYYEAKYIRNKNYTYKLYDYIGEADIEQKKIEAV